MNVFSSVGSLFPLGNTTGSHVPCSILLYTGSFFEYGVPIIIEKFPLLFIPGRISDSIVDSTFANITSELASASLGSISSNIVKSGLANPSLDPLPPVFAPIPTRVNVLFILPGTSSGFNFSTLIACWYWSISFRVVGFLTNDTSVWINLVSSNSDFKYLLSWYTFLIVVIVVSTLFLIESATYNP